MHVHINHMFCTDSNWGGTYWSRYMVTIYDKLTYDADCATEADWKLLKQVQTLDKDTLSPRRTHRLKPEVYAWLLDNVKDTKGANDQTDKGFCVGTDAYYSRAYGDFNIFFQRRRDAMAFIKKWSSHKKPTTYFDYFKEIRKELNFKTNTLQTVEEYTLR